MWFKSSKEVVDYIKEHTSLKKVYVNSWEGAIQPPYIVVTEGKAQSIHADDRNHIKKKRFYIEVFVKKTDNETAEIIENMLDGSETPYEKEVFWLNDLRLECHEFEI